MISSCFYEISATELTQATLDDIKAREEAANAQIGIRLVALRKLRPLMKRESMHNLLSGIPLCCQRQYLY